MLRLPVTFSVFLLAASALSNEPVTTSGLIASGTEWETPWYQITSEEPGPVFLLTGGVHGNEPSGAFAADQIRHWPVKKGTLIVIPSVNRKALENKTRRFPGLEGDEGDLNRHFPRSDEEETTKSPLAEAVWQFVKESSPFPLGGSILIPADVAVFPDGESDAFEGGSGLSPATGCETVATQS